MAKATGGDLILQALQSITELREEFHAKAKADADHNAKVQALLGRVGTSLGALAKEGKQVKAKVEELLG